MRKIELDIDPKSIQNAIDELKDYQDELNEKIKQFIQSLIEGGVVVAELCISSTKGDSKLPDVDYTVDANGDIVNATISIIGEDVLFVEFGAGIAYNTGKQHPKATELGYGPGTYPSKHPPNRALNPGFWFYSDHDSVGATVRTRSIGTEATMPAYHAAENMRNEVIRKAVEVFRS